MSYGRKFVREMEALGWASKLRKSNHYQLSHPEAEGFVICGRSPSDHRAYANLLAILKRKLRQGRPNIEDDGFRTIYESKRSTKV